jgi:NAD(P)-dependent dehydrogenase (short-subunit alcohol dehydrogenase family)
MRIGCPAEPSRPTGLRAEGDFRSHTIDVLVNNAGMAWIGPPLDMPLDVLQTMLRVNVEGVFIVSRAVLPHMITQRLGSVVNLAWFRRRRFPARSMGAGWGGGDAAGSERVVSGRRWPVSSLALLATRASVLTPSQTLPHQGPIKGEGLT